MAPIPAAHTAPGSLGRVLIGILLAQLAGPGAADPGAADAVVRRLTIRDMVALEKVGDPRIAPDGSRVAFVVTRLAADRGRTTALYLVDADAAGGEARRLTPEDLSARAPRWSADGKALYFIATGEGGPARIRRLDLATGTAATVGGEAATAGVRALAPSPDGRHIAFLKREPPSAEEAARRGAGDDAEVVGAPPRHVRLWLLDLSTGAVRALSRPDRTVWHFGWSPDSDALAVLASKSPIAEGHEYGSQLSLLALADGEERTLSPRVSAHADPSFSPDGRWIAFLAPIGDFVERGTVHVVATAGGTPRALLEAFPGNVWDLAWHPQGPVMLAAVGTGTEHRMIELTLDGAVRTLFTMHHSLMPYWTPMWSVDAAGERFAFLSESPDRPAEVWMAAAEGEARRLTHVNRALEAIRLAPVSAVRWRNPADGSEVEGVLVDPRPGGALLPLVVVLHGGPAYHWGIGAQIDSWAQLWAAEGYRVLLPNFRGSSGYGLGWMTRNVRDWGAGPMGDVMSGVDHLIGEGLADPQRLFLAGGSYGGYLSFWMLGHTGRFRAAFVRAGIADLATEYALTDEPSFLVGYFGATPYDDPEIYRAQSPLTYARAVATPLLMIHGAEDRRVPVSESRRFHDALRHHGSTSELVIYPREGHGIREPRHVVDSLERAVAWFRRWDDPAR